MAMALLAAWVVTKVATVYFAANSTWAMAEYGTWIGAVAVANLRFCDLIEPRKSELWLVIAMLIGALISGGLSGYSSTTGISWGLCYGVFAGVSNLAIILGYANSENGLKQNYGNIQVFLIYGISSSIGLISGGMLGSWLKVAGIIKLP
jgi:hypothetical protein